MKVRNVATNMRKVIAAGIIIFLGFGLGFYFYNRSESVIERKMQAFLSVGATPVEVKTWLGDNQYSVYTYSRSDLSEEYISDIKGPGLNTGPIGAAISASSKDYYDSPPFRRGERLVAVFDKSMKLKYYKVYD